MARGLADKSPDVVQRVEFNAFRPQMHEPGRGSPPGRGLPASGSPTGIVTRVAAAVLLNPALKKGGVRSPRPTTNRPSGLLPVQQQAGEVGRVQMLDVVGR